MISIIVLTNQITVQSIFLHTLAAVRASRIKYWCEPCKDHNFQVFIQKRMSLLEDSDINYQLIVGI